MKIKFEEFYLKNDGIYPADTYWRLYNKNHQEAIKKYEGHMFCPLCGLAPLTVAKGNKRRYFKVLETDMEKHDSECSYRRKKGNTRDINEFYKDLDRTDIKNRLISCMNRMLKIDIVLSDSSVEIEDKKSTYKKGFFNFICGSGEVKYLPHKNINSKTLDDDIDVQKIYYGKCALYLVKYIPQEENEIKMYYLKVLNQDTKKHICDICIPPYVYAYLENELKSIPEEREQAENYYLCFSGVLENGKYSYKCKLQDSRLIVWEKDM